MARAQDPRPAVPPTGEATPAPETRPEGLSPGGRQARQGGQGRTAQQTRVYKVGTIHPVSGPSISPGVLVVTGQRIVAVGQADQIEIPAGAQIVDLPDAHLYPGLVDAAAFHVTEAAANAGSELELALDQDDVDANRLARYGITTAFVGNQAEITWRGTGTVIRPRDGGFTVYPEARAAAVQARMTTAAAVMHPLERSKFLRGVGQVFEGLDAYEKSRKDHTKAISDYEKQWKEYVAFHAKKNDKPLDAEGNPVTEAKKPAETPEEKEAPETPKTNPDDPAKEPEKAEPKPAPEKPEPEKPENETPKVEPTPAPAPRTPPGSGRQRPGGQPQGPQGRPQGGRPQGTPAGGAPAATPAGATPAAAEAPKRPTWPKDVQEDPAKEALLSLRAGTLPLRVEANRPEEIRAALSMVAEHQVPRLILEGLADGASTAKEIAEAGVPVILMPAKAKSRMEPSFEADPALAGKLAKAGVSVSIASGDAKTARFLPQLAALAVAAGLEEATAIRAITLTPAELLGLGRQTGSLEANKLADLLFVSGPLLRSDTRILRVVGAGRTLYEAK